MPDSRLGPARRAADLASLRDGDGGSGPGPVDLVVVGGGITGVGIALDAASRGLDTVLLEAHDLAFGTSRWSSKLAHGGLRYLASGDVGIAARSAAERGILLERTAPHLTHHLAQVVPVHRSAGPSGAFLPGLGFAAGSLLGAVTSTGRGRLPAPSVLSRRRTAEWVPAVRRRGLLFGHLNWDCRLEDDARLVVALARTAAAHGARVLTRARVEHATGTSVRVVDTLTGDTTDLAARAVVNATGVWAAGLEESLTIRPSRGTHLVVATSRLGHPRASLTVPVPGSVSRFCFCLPGPHGRTYIGITDVDAPGEPADEPRADDDEVDFLLDVVGRALAVPLTREDVLATFSGLRPLIDHGDARETADLSREHAVLTADDGLVTVAGGKLTEYRLMAEQVVDLVAGRLGAAVGDEHGGRTGGRFGGVGGVGPCRTRDLPLVGAPGGPVAPRPARSPGEPPAARPPRSLPATLISRLGSEASTAVEVSLLDRPLDPVAPGLDVTRAEFSWAVTHEGALVVDDLLDRRTRLGLVPADRAAALPAAEEALAAAGAALG